MAQRIKEAHVLRKAEPSNHSGKLVVVLLVQFDATAPVIVNNHPTTSEQERHLLLTQQGDTVEVDTSAQGVSSRFRNCSLEALLTRRPREAV